MKKTVMRGAAAALIATSGIAVVGAGVANADVPCGKRTTHQAFKQWGDHGQYFLTESGTFENGAAGWKLSNADIAGFNAPWSVNGANHGRSLRIKPGGTASLRLCVTDVEDVIRFFYRTPKNGSSMRVTIDASTTSGWGRSQWSVWGSGRKWHVAPKVAIPSIRDGDGRVWITVSFENTGSNNMIIDDVMVDPWVAR